MGRLLCARVSETGRATRRWFHRHWRHFRSGADLSRGAKAAWSGSLGRVAGGHFWLIVSNSPRETFAEVAQYVIYRMQMYNIWLKEAGQTLFPEVNNEQQLRESGVLQVLSPQAAADAIGAYVEATGIERYHTWAVPLGVPAAEVNQYLELFASSVMPNLR